MSSRTKNGGFARMLERSFEQQEKRVAKKLPGWEGMRIPSSLAFQQASSTQTASFKAGLVANLSASLRIADLTGGLGVDASAFARVASAVLYNERSAELCLAARENFASLGIGNVAFSICDVGRGGEWIEKLKEFRPDVVYLDPARRDSAGRKLFLLEDCSPDLTAVLAEIFGICPLVLVKLSPMADISMLRARLGDCLRKVFVVALKGECKELLCLLENPGGGAVSWGIDGFGIDVVDASKPDLVFQSGPLDGETICPAPLSRPLDILLEPEPALLKAGIHNEFCIRNSLKKLDRFTHLYTCPSCATQDIPFCKRFHVMEVLPFCKESFRNLGHRFERAEVSAHNLPIDSAVLAAKIGCRTGSDIHIFGCTSQGDRVLVVCKK